MKLYVCNVWDSEELGDVFVGVFSTPAKAMEAGSLYMNEHSVGDVHLLDWSEEAPLFLHWYTTDSNHNFTRVVREIELDSRAI